MEKKLYGCKPVGVFRELERAGLGCLSTCRYLGFRRKLLSVNNGRGEEEVKELSKVNRKTYLLP